GSGSSKSEPKPGGFGKALYAAAAAQQIQASTNTANTNTRAGFTTYGMQKNAHYATVPGETFPPMLVHHTFNRDALQRLIDQSAQLKSKGLTVDVEGRVVVLRGDVATTRERRVAENIVRLTPGVREVQNELRVLNEPPGDQARLRRD